MISIPFRPRRSNSNKDENPYWISFSDIMAGLLVIFILASIHLILELTEQKENIQKDIILIQRIHEIRAEMLQEIKDELAKENILVEISDNESVIHIPDELAFEENKAEIPKDKEAFVASIGMAVFNAIKKENRLRFIDTVFIEGHTDSRPAPRYPNGNWGLSTDRAISIWKHWTNNLDVGKQIEEMVNRDDQNIFSVSGYAETRTLVYPDTTEVLRRKNRRIDMRFTMFTPRIEDFLTIMNKVQ